MKEQRMLRFKLLRRGFFPSAGETSTTSGLVIVIVLLKVLWK